MITLHAADEDATRAIAAALARALAASGIPTVVIGLSGDLGAGKTAFVRGFVAGLDPARERDVTSPTYAIAHLYPGAPPVRHLDLYRLSTAADLEAIGGRDLYADPGLVLVEWIDRVPEALPAVRIDVTLESSSETARTLRIEAHGAELAAVLDALSATVIGRA